MEIKGENTQKKKIRRTGNPFRITIIFSCFFTNDHFVFYTLNVCLIFYRYVIRVAFHMLNVASVLMGTSYHVNVRVTVK